MRLQRPWYFSHPTTAVTLQERNYLWMAVSHKCKATTSSAIPTSIGLYCASRQRSCHNVAMRHILLLLVCLGAWAADSMPPLVEQRLAREIYKQMIEVKSGFTTGSTTPIAESVAARFRAAGFPASDIFVGGAIPTKANVVVRYRGTGAHKPILLLAHIDVVEAKREDWSF